MSQADIDDLDRRMDLAARARAESEDLAADADGEIGLVRTLAGLHPVDWPERATGARISTAVAAALDDSPRWWRQLQQRDQRPTDTRARRAAASRRSHRPHVRTHRRLTVLAAAAIAAVVGAAATVSVLSKSPGPAPVSRGPFRSSFRSALLATIGPGVVRAGNSRPGLWELASYLTVPGWRSDETSKPADSISCPSVTICYVTAARPVGIQVAGSNFDLIEATRNGGLSWDVLGLPGNISITTPLQCPRSAVSCLASGYDAGRTVLLRTADGGRTWSATGIPSASFADQLACASDTACAGIFQIGSWRKFTWRVLVTGNGGKTWSAGPASPRGQVPDYLTCRGQRCVVIDQLVTSDNSQSVNGTGPVTIAPGSWAVWYSRDGGAHWRRGSHPGSIWTLPTHDLPNAGALSCASGGHCWALATTSSSPDGPAAILASSDGGATWSAQSLPAGLARGFFPQAISCPTPRRCWAGGGQTTSSSQAPLMVATSDAGASWHQVRLPEPVAGIGQSRPTVSGLLPWIGLLSCPGPTHCVAIPGTNENARRVPVLSLSGPGRS